LIKKGLVDGELDNPVEALSDFIDKTTMELKKKKINF